MVSSSILNTSFSINNNTGRAIQQISVDFDGDGSTDFNTTNPEDVIAFTYDTAGVYQATVTVTDDQNDSHARTLAIVVHDGQEMDQMFTELWNGMNAMLTLGNSSGATQFLDADAKAKYQPVFDVLLPHLLEIVASYSPLVRVTVSESIGEYAVVRRVNGQNRLFLIYFLKDIDGVWRLDAM